MDPCPGARGALDQPRMALDLDEEEASGREDECLGLGLFYNINSWLCACRLLVCSLFTYVHVTCTLSITEQVAIVFIIFQTFT